MGHQILIIALTGMHNPALPADITKHLAAKGLQIRHACLTYEGRTSFAVGTHDDLARELAEAGHPHGIIGETADDAPEGVTLETVLEEVRAHHEDFRKFVAYEKREDQDDLKAPKPAKPRAKKEAAAPDVPKPPVETPASPPAPQEPQEQGNAENAPPLTSNSPQGDGNPTE